MEEFRAIICEGWPLNYDEGWESLVHKTLQISLKEKNKNVQTILQIAGQPMDDSKYCMSCIIIIHWNMLTFLYYKSTQSLCTVCILYYLLADTRTMPDHELLISFTCINNCINLNLLQENTDFRYKKFNSKVIQLWYEEQCHHQKMHFWLWKAT